MSTTVNKTPQTETHPEQEKRMEMAQRVEDARQGKLPDNSEVVSGLSKAQTGIAKNDDQLSATGRAVTNDINNILETAKTIVNEKNDGNLMQKAYYHSNQAGGRKSFSDRIAALRNTNYGSGDRDAVRNEAKQNINSMGTILKLAFLSPEFRETINDIAQISNQLLKSREDKNNGTAPTENVSREAPAAGAAPATGVAAPATGAAAPATGAAAPVDPSTLAAPSQAIPVATAPLVAGTQPGMNVCNPGSSVPVAGGAAAGAPAAGAPGAVPRDVSGTVASGAAPGAGATGAASGSGARRKMTRDEKEDLLIERLVDLARTLHKNPEYRNAIEYIAGSMDKLRTHAIATKEEGKAVRAQDKVNEPRSEIEHHKKEAQLNSKEFAENWIGDDYSLDRLLNQIDYLHKSSKNDPELRQLLQDWKTWSTSTIKDSSYVEDRERVRNDTKDLVRRTRMMSQGPYRDQFTILRREVNYINKAIQRDDSVQALRKDISQLGRDVFMDQNGKAVLKPELFGDAQKIIAGILEAIKYIPLPPIHKNDENMELQLENIVLTATEVAPSNIRIIAQSDMEKTGADQSRQNDNSIAIELSKIRAHLTSINFFVDKKTGFPKITERGLADVDLLGTNGLNLVVELAPKVQKTGNNVHSLFEPKNVTCTIDKLKIHLRETSHDFLYKLISPIMNMVAKKKIETGVADAIRDGINKFNTNASAGATNQAVRADQKVHQSDRVQTNNPGATTAKAAGPTAGPNAHEPVPADQKTTTNNVPTAV